MAFPKKAKKAKAFEGSKADKMSDKKGMAAAAPAFKKGGFVPFKKKGKK
jgi:hypothetical protein